MPFNDHFSWTQDRTLQAYLTKTEQTKAKDEQAYEMEFTSRLLRCDLKNIYITQPNSLKILEAYNSKTTWSCNDRGPNYLPIYESSPHTKQAKRDPYF